MEFDLAQKRSEAQNLKNRINELEQQLADAQQTIHTLRAGGLSKATQAGTEIPFASEEGYRQALLGAPYPLMIWREGWPDLDGQYCLYRDQRLHPGRYSHI